MCRIACVLLGLAVSHSALAKSFFIAPPEGGPTSDYTGNQVFTLGQNATFKWESEYRKVDVTIWNDNPNITDPPSATILENSKSESLVWEVTYDVFPDGANLSSPVFFLALYEPGNGTAIVLSHYFNITAGAATSSLAPTAPTASSAVSSTATGTTPPAQTSSSTQQGEGLSRGTVAGITIGVTLAAVLALGSLGYFLWRRRCRTRALGGNDKAGDAFQTPHDSHQLYPQEWKPVPQLEPAELENKVVRPSEPVELSAERR